MDQLYTLCFSFVCLVGWLVYLFDNPLFTHYCSRTFYLLLAISLGGFFLFLFNLVALITFLVLRYTFIYWLLRCSLYYTVPLLHCFNFAKTRSNSVKCTFFLLVLYLFVIFMPWCLLYCILFVLFFSYVCLYVCLCLCIVFVSCRVIFNV